jgi:hypothetical protein
MKRPLRRHSRTWEDNNKMDHGKRARESEDWTELAKDTIKWRVSVNTIINHGAL